MDTCLSVVTILHKLNTIIQFQLSIIYINFHNFSLERILNPEPLSLDYNKPKHIHNIEAGHQICSLTSTDAFLIIGTVNEILGYDWKNVVSAKVSKPSWRIKIASVSSIEQIDVNSLWLSEDEAKLYSGCGDNNIYVHNMDDGRLLSTFKGHTDFVHSVHGK